MHRRIAVVGSGIVGLVAAHGLRKQGHEVTLYSDRSPEDWLHRSSPTGGALLVEAIPGRGFDRFRDCTDGATVLARMKELIRERMPWDWAWVEDAALADERGWLVGRVLPSIRGPLAQLPSGAVAMAIGDTAMSLDPCAGQGANNGLRMVAHLLQAISARAEGPLDAAWIDSTFDDFYRDSGAATYLFSDLMTRPASAAAQSLFTAAYGSTGAGDSVEQRIADAIAHNFVDPRSATTCFLEPDQARALISRISGSSARWHLLKRTLAIAKQQLRQRVGLAPQHP